MTVLTRWEPFRELNALQHRMNRLFEEQYGGGREESLTRRRIRASGRYLRGRAQHPVEAGSAGHRRERPGRPVENNVLTVSGERKFEKEEKEENFRRVERRYGSFSRSFTLPNTVNTEDIHADYDNGVLEDPAGQASRSQAEADQGQRRQPEGARRQEAREPDP